MMRHLRVQIAADSGATETVAAQVLSQLEGIGEYRLPAPGKLELHYDLRQITFEEIHRACAASGLRLHYRYCDRLRQALCKRIEHNLQAQAAQAPNWQSYLSSAYIRCGPRGPAELSRRPQWTRHLQRHTEKKATP